MTFVSVYFYEKNGKKSTAKCKNCENWNYAMNPIEALVKNSDMFCSKLEIETSPFFACLCFEPKNGD